MKNTNTSAFTISVPVLGSIEVKSGSVSLNDFVDFGDVIIDGKNTIVKIRVYDGGFDISRIGKSNNNVLANHVGFKFEDYPDVDELVEYVLNGYTI